MIFPPIDKLLRSCPSGTLSHFLGPLMELEAKDPGRAFEWVVHSCIAVIGSETSKTPPAALGWLRRLLETEPTPESLCAAGDRLWYRPRRDFVQTAICRAFGARASFLGEENDGYLRELSSCLDVLFGGLPPDQAWSLDVAELFNAYLQNGWNVFDWNPAFPVRFRLLAAEGYPRAVPSNAVDELGRNQSDAVIATATRRLQENQRTWAAECIYLAERTLRYGGIQWGFTFLGHLWRSALPSVPPAGVHWLKCMLCLRKSGAVMTALDDALDEYCIVRRPDQADVATSKLCASLMFLMEGHYDAYIASLILAVEDVADLAIPEKGRLAEGVKRAFLESNNAIDAVG